MTARFSVEFGKNRAVIDRAYSQTPAIVPVLSPNLSRSTPTF